MSRVQIDRVLNLNFKLSIFKFHVGDSSANDCGSQLLRRTAQRKNVATYSRLERARSDCKGYPGREAAKHATASRHQRSVTLSLRLSLPLSVNYDNHDRFTTTLAIVDERASRTKNVRVFGERPKDALDNDSLDHYRWIIILTLTP